MTIYVRNKQQAGEVPAHVHQQQLIQQHNMQQVE
jgi:hypothetical protein